MAGRRPPAGPTVGDVPAELLDVAHETWSDTALFAAWLQRHDLGESGADGWFAMFTTGRDRWCVANGYLVITGRSGQTSRDDQRLKDAGVPWIHASARGCYMAGNPAPTTWKVAYPDQLPKAWVGN